MMPYHLAVAKAAALLDLDHELLTRPDDELAQLPPRWYPALGGAVLNRRGQFRGLFGMGRLFRGLWDFAHPLWQHTQALHKRGRRAVLFIEIFNLFELFAYTLAALAAPRGTRVLIMFRFPPATLAWYSRHTYRACVALLRLRYSKDRLHLVTDSDLLREALEPGMDYPFTVLPVPHTHLPSPSTDGSRSPLLCWWGGFPSEDKGWSSLRRLVNLPNDTGRDITVIAAPAAELEAVAGGVRVEPTSNTLDEAAWARLLHRVHITLMPYSPIRYGACTSGIFVEAVTAGKLPLVSEGTWMAYELRKHDLPELILDWNDPQVLHTIVARADDADVARRLAHMQEAYRNYHTVEGFAQALAAVL